MRYLTISVFGNTTGSDCSLNGVSKTHDQKLVVEHENGFLTAEDVEAGGYVVLELVTRSIGGKDYFSFKPKSETRWVMFGGNFAYTSDSRFGKFSDYPVPIHDRIER